MTPPRRYGTVKRTPDLTPTQREDAKELFEAGRSPGLIAQRLCVPLIAVNRYITPLRIERALEKDGDR